MDATDEEVVRKIRDGFEKLVDDVGVDLDIDMGYYDFQLEMITRDESFQPAERSMIKEFEYGLCAFCGKKTMYYDREEDKYLCPMCYAKLHNKR